MARTSPPRKDKNRVPRAKRELPVAPPKEAERVAKVIARAGLGSRREIEEWIVAGRVAVNGTVLDSPAFTVTPADAITVDGEPLPERERTRLFLYHKPRGVVTTNRDPEGRATLFEILPRGLPRLVSVGRLDLNSEGLLLLTNDGGLARVLELPETGWLRRYRVRANGEIDQAQLDSLLGGITVDGVEYGPIEAVLDRVQGANAWITVALREGKNREVRNVLGGLGLKVNRLIRVSYGPFQLGEIPEGGIEEVRTRVLREQIGEEIATAAGADFAGPLVERELEAAPPLPRPAGRKQAQALEEAPRRSGARRPREEEFEDQFREAAPRRRLRDEPREVERRGTVADRKGRTVKVERVVARPEGDEDAPRRGPARSRGPARDREFSESRFEGGRGERPARAPRRFAEGDAPRSRAPRGEGAERPARPRGPAREREFSGERPERSSSFGPKPFGSGKGGPKGRPAGKSGFGKSGAGKGGAGKSGSGRGGPGGKGGFSKGGPGKGAPRGGKPGGRPPRG